MTVSITLQPQDDNSPQQVVHDGDVCCTTRGELQAAVHSESGSVQRVQNWL